MKIPGTFVSKFGLTSGMSTPRFSVPKTSSIASVGQADLHAPWPMQAAAFTSTALPLTMPSACSGHDRTHTPLAMQ